MIQKTLLSHLYNEEYLLPWWLEHHKNMFDHGVLIDYNSTDRSIEIIRSICPTWDIVTTKNQFFGAKVIDDEVSDVENNYAGWKICLNTTEFLIGNLNTLSQESNSGVIIPCYSMVDNNPEDKPSYSVPLIEQKYFGIKPDPQIRRPRYMHNKHYYMYPLGRHIDQSPTTDELAILWYGWAPFNEDIIKRKLQIQTRMPASDKSNGLGTQHLVDRNKLQAQYLNYLSRATDLREELKKI